MTDTKFTPGPWEVADYKHALAIECKVNGIGHTVVTDQFCFPNFKHNKDPEKYANAALIAAAPEMFAALLDRPLQSDDPQVWENWEQQVQQIIKKVTTPSS